MQNKNEEDTNKPIDISKIKIEFPKIELPLVSDGEVDESRLWDAIHKSVEPFGSPRERFAALIRAAYSYVDPYAVDLPGHVGEVGLVSLAKENNGENNAYTDLKEMLEQFDKALGK